MQSIIDVVLGYFSLNIRPIGAFTFVSKFWIGNVSDRKVTVDSKFLDLISPGDEVMADRGFQIKDLLTMKGANLNMPPLPMREEMGREEYSHLNRFLKLARLLLFASMSNELSEDSNPTKC